MFDHVPVHTLLPDWMGVVHAMEVPFVFGAPFKNIQDPFVNMMVTKYSEIEKGLSFHIMKLWTDFAKYGYETWILFLEFVIDNAKCLYRKSRKTRRLWFWIPDPPIQVRTSPRFS